MRNVKSEHGSVLIMAAVMVVVLLGFLALAIDVGMVLTAKSELQNVADSAAFAGVNKLASNDYWSAVYQATVFGGLNSCLNQLHQFSTGDIQLGLYNFDQNTFVEAPVANPSGSNAIYVVARRAQGSV